MSLKKSIKKIINKIRGIPHGMMTPWYNELYAKKYDLDKSKNNIQTLCVGSSHGAYGFKPSVYSDTSFNLCSTSQDLYSSCHLVENLKKELNLNKIILFYSVFSPGYEVQKTRDFQVCAYLSAFFDVNYQFDEKVKELNAFAKAALKITSQKKYQKIPSERGYTFSPQYALPDMSAADRAKAHLRENQRPTNQNQYLEKLINSNIKVEVILSPARKAYKDNLPPSSELFKDLFTLADKYDINITNLYDNTSFNDDDFLDFDHLNQQGAEKLSIILKERFGA